LNLLSDEEWERSGEGVPRDRQLRRGLDPLYRGNAHADLPRRSLDADAVLEELEDFTRSTIIERSNSANTPIIWNSAVPAGVEVSTPC